MSDDAKGIESAVARALKLASDHSAYKAFRNDAEEDEAVRLLGEFAHAVSLLVPLLERAEGAATYAAATLSPGNRHGTDGELTSIHAGRADSSYRQLDNVRSYIRATRAEIVESLQPVRQS